MANSILDKQFYFVTGKGGVGKSALSLSLAKSLASQGKRTLWVELAETSIGQACFSNFHGQFASTNVAPNLFASRITLRPTLEEYMHIIFKISAIAQRIAKNDFFQTLTNALPGMESLVFLGKLEYELNRKKGGRRYWDAVVFDAPATGHALTMLRFPGAASDIVPVGPVLEAAKRQDQILRDPNRCAIIIATLAEELPVTETLELAAGIRECGYRTSEVWANNLFIADPKKAKVDDLIEAGVKFATKKSAKDRLEFLHHWYDLQKKELADLAQGLNQQNTDINIREIPFVAGRIPEQTDRLAQLIKEFA